MQLVLHVLKGTHEFSKLVLTTMALLMDQSRSVLPAQVGQSAGIWGVVAGKMYARALDLSFIFRPARPDE